MNTWATRPDGSQSAARERVTPLERLASLAEQAGLSQLAAQARSLAERIEQGRFFVACVGQFKRGKSSLLNALVGEPILPAGVLPVTAVVTIVRWGPRRAARILTPVGWREIEPSSLVEYVAEERNPGNQKGVTAIEVFVPSELLADGLCLVDTPGLGSVFAAASEATEAFLPHIDVALVVVGGDPPISAAELALVEKVATQVDRIILVLNKADRLSAADVAEAKRFAEQVLAQKLNRSLAPILEVSAAERLEGRGPTRDWNRLESSLRALARESGAALLKGARQRGLQLLVAQLLYELDEQRGALSRPIAESEQRIATLRACAAEAERSMSDLGYLLTAEQERLRQRFSRQREAFLARAIPAARAELIEALRGSGEPGSAPRQRALSLARQIFTSWVDRWRDEEQPRAEQSYREAAARFVELANGFIERLASSQDPALARLPRALGPELGFRTQSRLYYSGLMTLTRRSPLRWLADLFRSRAGRLRSAERDSADYLERLLAANAAGVTSDLEERVLESRRRLEAELRSSLAQIHGSAEHALEKARAHQAAGHDAVRNELERIDAMTREAVQLLPAAGDESL